MGLLSIRISCRHADDEESDYWAFCIRRNANSAMQMAQLTVMTIKGC